MTALARLLFTFVALACVLRAVSTPGCVAIEGERILAADLALGLPAFSSVPADTQIGYAPVPGARRFFRPAELQRLAARYHVPLPADAALCIERVLELLRPESVIAAMRQALGDPEAKIEIVELSRFPVPRGELEFVRSALPPVSTGPALWRGAVRYAGGRRFAVWARVNVRVMASRIVAVEALAAGKAIAARQLKLEQYPSYPSSEAGKPALDQAVGRIPRNPIAAGRAVAPPMLDAPKEVETGDVVQVEVRSGAARLGLEGRAQSAGRHGQSIPIRNLDTGKSFSARVVGKDRVVLTTALPESSKDVSK